MDLGSTGSEREYSKHKHKHNLNVINFFCFIPVNFSVELEFYNISKLAYGIRRPVADLGEGPLILGKKRRSDRKEKSQQGR